MRQQITVDVTKVDKARLVERKYKNKSGEEVTQKLLKLETVDIKEPKVVAHGETWKLVKVGFATQARTKEERVAKVNMPIIGEVLVMQDKGSQSAVGDEISASEIPF